MAVSSGELIIGKTSRSVIGLSSKVSGLAPPGFDALYARARRSARLFFSREWGILWRDAVRLERIVLTSVLLSMATSVALGAYFIPYSVRKRMGCATCGIERRERYLFGIRTYRDSRSPYTDWYDRRIGEGHDHQWEGIG